jgi:hypothetical protein
MVQSCVLVANLGYAVVVAFPKKWCMGVVTVFVLYWLPVAVFTGVFLYNIVLGGLHIYFNLSSKARNIGLEKLVWTQFLFITYQLLVSTWNTSFLSPLAFLVRDLWEDSWFPKMANETTFSPWVHKDLAWVVNPVFSHILCGVLGTFADHGITHLVNVLAEKYKVFQY